MDSLFRLILDPPRPAAANMARDEALLVSAERGVATLRFYQWDPPAVSLGYFQPIDAYESARSELDGLDLVRRPTGGGAILHHAELTYSLGAPTDWPIIAGRPTSLYRLAHEAIAATLNELGVPARFHDGPAEGNAQRGPFFCFARRHPYDLLVGADKIVGSAQRRRPAALLQHGSIILKRVAPQPCTGVNDHAAAVVTAQQLIERLRPRFESALQIQLNASDLTGDETETAREFEAKYRSNDWTRQR